MAYNEYLADAIRQVVEGRLLLVEKKMFGGLCFMLAGHMCVGVVKDDLMVRVGPKVYAEALKLPAAREMDFTGKPLKGYVFVNEEGWLDSDVLMEWVMRGVAFVASLPPKN